VTLELLRFATAGSVDDGKSTLIGRLLHDSKAVYEDQLESLRKASAGNLDLAFITDGLKAEREQGITIDVAHRYFSTPRRRFILADSPGHEQYTRNMATAVSTAQAVVILLDARKGVLPQTKRHFYIAWLLGIRQIAVVFNKMDLVDYREDVFADLCEQWSHLAARLPGCRVQIIPASALKGDNVVSHSERMPWYHGGGLLEFLEQVPISPPSNGCAFRFPVQYVIRADGDMRAYAGQIASGSVQPGDDVLILPSRKTARVVSISTYGGDLQSAVAPMSVALRLDKHLDVGRGNMLVDPEAPPSVTCRIRARLVWMSETPLALFRPYLIKHTTRQFCAEVVKLVSKVDLETLEEQPASNLGLNEIGTVEIETHQPLFLDLYEQSRSTGNFILIDPITNQTLAGATITGALEGNLPSRTAPVYGRQRGLTVWFTGLASSGKTTLSRAVYQRLWAMGCKVEILDGDTIRQNLSRDLNFAREDRDENIRRIGFVAELLTRNGVIVLVAAISPYRALRDEVRRKIGNFVEVYVNAPLEVCEQRDVKGLYKRVRAGEISQFTGIDDPYEPPLEPELECYTDQEAISESVNRILQYLNDRF
jgi:bifunctional enzyme CysN/CysC